MKYFAALSSLVLVSASAVLSVGCAGMRTRQAVHTAAIDHNCAQENIHEIDQHRGTVVLDVCGERRVYRDMGDQHTVLWTDVTNTTR